LATVFSALTLTRGGAGYIGAPAVVNSGGNGTGATAYRLGGPDASTSASAK
jgi:hypothetical protein